MPIDRSYLDENWDLHTPDGVIDYTMAEYNKYKKYLQFYYKKLINEPSEYTNVTPKIEYQIYDKDGEQN